MAAVTQLSVHLGDVLEGIGAQDDGRYFDWQELMNKHETGRNPLLYTSLRDVLPAQEVRSELAGKDMQWHGDMVAYTGVELGNGEPCRSTGHWNPPGQVEVFQVATGAISMLMAVGFPDIKKLWSVDAKVGDVIVAPLNSWHVTYAPHGAATVFNVYTGVNKVSSDVKTSEKYRKQAPVPTWLVSNQIGDLLWTASDIKEFDPGNPLLHLRDHYGPRALYNALAKGDHALLDGLVAITYQLEDDIHGDA